MAKMSMMAELSVIIEMKLIALRLMAMSLEIMSFQKRKIIEKHPYQKK